MPMIDGVKYACEPCMRGHRSSKCNHNDRILIKVRKPGRPLSSCPHEAGSCSCEVASVAIPRVVNSGGCCKGNDSKNRQCAHTHAPLRILPSNSSRNQSHDSQPYALAPEAVQFMPEDPKKATVPGYLPTPLWPAPDAPFGTINPMTQLSSQGPMMGTAFFGGNLEDGLGSGSSNDGLNGDPNAPDGKAFFMDPTSGLFDDFQSNAQQPYIDQNGRRHTTDPYSRQLVDPNLDARSASVPNVPLMLDSAQFDGTFERPQGSQYTIYTAATYNHRQMDYMNSIREAHERQKLEDPDAAKRASQANEHAQRLNGSSCCSPPRDTDSNNFDNSIDANFANSDCIDPNINGASDPAFAYALPHTGICTCGPGCKCLMCISHPYNQASIDYVRNLHQMQSLDQSPEEQSPATLTFPQSGGPGMEFPSNGAFFAGPLNGLPPDETQRGLSPSNFIQIDYPMGSCSQQNGNCLCGAGCQCLGCATHGGHTGLPANMEGFDMQSASVLVESHPSGSPVGNGAPAADASSSSGSMVHVEVPENGEQTI
ncbi:hypothetical protein Dda_2969 [Drechslerella dactyloides]|uniref:Copper-fist domain-containing protein n=1 Tax=Drechslerella dactyloides TaxID=74499 RepID=A0AAD6NKT8_DREDA|nr:hypothetical protein Dda_2969 [Drechslerella dactyloides]